MITSRLVLSNSQLLQTASPWPDDANFVVGPIFFVNETRVTYPEEEALVEVTPAHYEVWQVPMPFLERMFAGEYDGIDEMFDSINELKCLRVWLSGNVSWAEERWVPMRAAEVITDRFKDLFTDAGFGANEEAPQPNGQPQPTASAES